MRGLFPTTFAAGLAALALSCGGAEPDTVPATHDDFRAIQRYEATVAASVPIATDPEVDCEAGCAATRDACEASGRICAIADGTADLDALTRCERSRDACRQAEASTSSRCGCGHD